MTTKGKDTQHQKQKKLTLKSVHKEVCRIRKDSPISKQVEDAFNIMLDALNRYGTTALSMSFNGGKDCTVMLHLYYAVLYQYLTDRAASKITNGSTNGSSDNGTLAADGNGTSDTTITAPPIKCLYVTCVDPFPEVDDFVDECTQVYNLDLDRIAEPMKEALQKFLDVESSVQAILIGTRRTDPFAQNLIPFDPTDNGWPSVMRVHPILDWDYADIWMYLRLLEVDYCSLYDRGYTSLGGIGNTLPNPALANPLVPGEFLPAYELKDAVSERDGRGKSKSS
ncbi:hypothetical protein SmJEL517_g03276 [Synchytrium microbalum]|uniref:FAD synthase n=1 Tax=Synchytrium microbalum TaxID=1806994 RepID=A0A507C3N3_9FUNG|nr:uncharacterized protein SmJEL517_g03276 [Synchytrium microbalum]TPX34081.1 hypothetical protein SmJEL517_g03276 [Synchytrium microbalum]